VLTGLFYFDQVKGSGLETHDPLIFHCKKKKTHAS
jgi:hypothetical protein